MKYLWVCILGLVLFSALIFMGCMAGTGIYKTDPATAEFYGASVSVHRCTLLETNPLFGASKSLSLLASLPDDTTQQGSLSIGFTYTAESWGFISSIEMKVDDTIYQIAFSSPSREVVNMGGVMCVESGLAEISTNMLMKMLSSDISFRYAGEVHSLSDKCRQNLLEWWKAIPQYWQNRIQINAQRIQAR